MMHRGSAKPINVAILLLIIFNSGGITIFDHYYITIATLLLLALKQVIRKRFSITVFSTAMIFFSILLLFNVVATNSWSGIKEYLVFISYVVTAAWLLSSYRASNDNFANDLFLALKIVLYQAILSFLFQFIGGSLLFPISDREITFYYLFFYIPDALVGTIYRNQGVFWEPGVLQLYLNLLFYIAFFLKKNLWISTLAAIAIFTTFSTTGYLILLLLILAAFMHRIRRSKIAILGMIILLPVISIPVFMNVMDKFTGEHAESANVRMFDFAIGVNLLLDHPMTGIGIGQNYYKSVFYQYGIDSSKNYGLSDDELESKGITNSVLFFATAFGLPIAILFMVLLYRQTLLSGSPGLLFAMFFISGLSEPIFNTTFFVLLFISGLFNMGKFNIVRFLSLSKVKVSGNGKANKA